MGRRWFDGERYDEYLWALAYGSWHRIAALRTERDADGWVTRADVTTLCGVAAWVAVPNLRHTSPTSLPWNPAHLCAQCPP